MQQLRQRSKWLEYSSVVIDGLLFTLSVSLIIFIGLVL